MLDPVSHVRSPKEDRSPRTTPRPRRRRSPASEIPLQLLALGVIADGAASPISFVQAALRDGIRDAEAILRHSLTTANTTVEDLLVQRAQGRQEWAALESACDDSALSNLVCDVTREGLFAGMALTYLFLEEDRRTKGGAR